MTLQSRVLDLIVIHGSLRAAARAAKVDAAYLHRLRYGHKTSPSAAVLRRLGLRRVVTFEAIRAGR